MILKKFEKQPADVKDYDIFYTEWLVPGDALNDAVVVIEPSGNPSDLKVDSVFVAPDKVKIWLSAGITNTLYKATVTATTDDGRVVQHEFVMKVRDR